MNVKILFMGKAIVIENLSFKYRGSGRFAIHDLAAEVEEGGYVVLMGHSGAGKSTLCYCLNGIVPSFFRGDISGNIRIKGHEILGEKVADLSKVVGLVLQDFEAQLFSTNVELELAFGPENLCIHRDEIRRRVERYLSFMGLEAMRYREPASLSGGQKQRLAIGSILTMEPDILVMDEPTTDLDPIGRKEVLGGVQELRNRGKTILVVDHDVETARDADQIWLMRDGRIVTRGNPREILSDTELLESCGVKPPALVELFRAMGWPGAPLTAEEAMATIQREQLLRSEKSRRKKIQPSDPGGSVVLKAEGISYRYPTYRFDAIRDIDLKIREGEFVAILGQNGSGKTTLAKHFNGLLKPTFGRMLLKGKPTTSYSHREIARLVGYVFQNPDHQIFSRSVYEEVAFGLRMMGEHPGLIAERVAEALEVVGLQGYEQKVPFALTKGDRQRLAVASVLAIQPMIIILDEPTTGLDAFQQRGIMEMLRRLNKKGHTIIFITHSMELAAEYATRVVVMKEGGIILDGPTRAVFAEEDRLRETNLRPPPIVELSNRLGSCALTVKQMVEELS